MLRQALIYIILSILVVIFAKYFHLLVLYIDTFFTYISVKMTSVFSMSHIGLLTRKVIVLIFLPVLIAALPALAYRAVKGGRMPYFMELTWLLWLVIVLSNVLIR
ncbi:hypothetical protein E3983_04705 [Legionella israelensis]|uniref:Uncharacterized protein n=1 Tax=Legionella israelensis TaxID=454 RepID=A0AAX1EF52_9GAMM|nr:hypothetical protein [Legionella israelensis]QBR83714.1 hypothetical protein E3983_04705 [Legionella israelensis]